MTEQEFRKRQAEWDKRSLEKRVKRWKDIVPATYDVPLPDLVWYYLTEADEMYINGHFIGVISVCGSIAELVLIDQVVLKSQIIQEKLKGFSFEQLVILARRLGVLEDEEANQLNGLRKLRNSLVHARAGKLAEMAKKRIQILGSNDIKVYAGLYLKPLGDDGIAVDALECLTLVRNLTVRFYGAD